MPKERMDVKASDNEYLHKDFHGAMSTGIQYLEDKHGPDAVLEYMQQLAVNCYGKLTEDIKQRGLQAIRDHYQRIYDLESGVVEFEQSSDQLVMTVKKCPAVSHMVENNYPVAGMFVETQRALNAAICNNTGYAAELLSYDDATGACVLKFSKTGDIN